MKKTLFSLMLICAMFITSTVMAQTDKIEGIWYNDVKTAKIEISKGHDGKFYGKMVWLKEPLKDGKPKLDDNNTNESLRKRPILGMQLLQGFEKDGDDKYTNGTIYDPLNGKTYSCKMTYKGKTLAIRGFIGVSLFGRTTVWLRADS